MNEPEMPPLQFPQIAPDWADQVEQADTYSAGMEWATPAPTPKIEVRPRTVMVGPVVPLGMSIFASAHNCKRRGRIDRAARCRGVMAEDRGKVEPVRERGDVGRNDPCPCGSGDKFKRCCGR